MHVCVWVCMSTLYKHVVPIISICGPCQDKYILWLKLKDSRHYTKMPGLENSHIIPTCQFLFGINGLTIHVTYTRLDVKKLTDLTTYICPNAQQVAVDKVGVHNLIFFL